MLVTWGSTSRVTRSRSHPIPGIPGIPSPRVADRQSIFVAPTKITDGTAIWVCLKIVYPFLNPMVLPIMKSLFFMAISLGIYPTFSDKAISPHFPAVFGWKTADHWDLLTTSRLLPGCWTATERHLHSCWTTCEMNWTSKHGGYPVSPNISLLKASFFPVEFPNLGSPAEAKPIITGAV